MALSFIDFDSFAGGVIMEPVTTARAEFDESGKPTKHVYVIDDDPQLRHRANALGKLK